MTIRGKQVILDRDLASLYGVETKSLNQAVKRNLERFPLHYRFQLTKDETDEVVTNCDHLSALKYSPNRAYAFTENGVAMLSAVLRSAKAIKVSLLIMDAFVNMRHFLLANAQVFQRLDKIELKQLETDHKIEQVFAKLEETAVTPKQGIFFDGQIYDAYEFICGLIKSATTRIVLIDNYIDETVLTMLDKREAGVTATIYTRQISQQLNLDITKHNAQYTPIEVHPFNKAHDRFLIIDERLYHIGASLKDLGSKWFAFSIMNDLTPDELLSKL
ncbi:MAG: ORF6N domain-containing protein [Bacteroidales bacterium]|nr:ORF6N domain-containing protein [Bacteroidales bacterium]